MDLEEARAEIDRIDGQIVELIGRRAQVVSVIGRLKGRADVVRDLAREQVVVDRVRSRAVQSGIDPNLAEDIYRRLLDYFVKQQIKDLEGGGEFGIKRGN